MVVKRWLFKDSCVSDIIRVCWLDALWLFIDTLKLWPVTLI